MRPITNSVPIEKISTPGSCAMLPAPLLTVALLSHHATPILPVCRCPRKITDLAIGAIAPKNPSRFFPQGVEQRLGLLEVEGIKAFGGPSVACHSLVNPHRMARPERRTEFAFQHFA